MTKEESMREIDRMLENAKTAKKGNPKSSYWKGVIAGLKAARQTVDEKSE